MPLRRPTTLDLVSVSETTLSANRYDTEFFASPFVDGTGSDDVMGDGCTDTDGDQIDGRDANKEVFDGATGDDSLHAGSSVVPEGPAKRCR